jgi:hypothetical protein
MSQEAERAEPRRPRHFRDDTKEPRSRDAFKQLMASLKRIVNDFPPDTIAAGGGLYYGPGLRSRDRHEAVAANATTVSIAYLFFVLQRIYENLEIEGHPLGVWAALYLQHAQKHMKDYPGPDLRRCGVSDDIMAMMAMDAASTRDFDLVKELCDFANVTTDPDATNEWLYGKAGYLYLLRLVKVCFADDVKAKELIDDTADEVIEAIMEAPRPWKWHNKAYVGAVHGSIGIITQIILTDTSWAPKLEAELGALLSYQYESGNWPSSIPPGRDRLVQVCHGAPGVIISLQSIKKYFPKLKDKIEKAIEKGRACILERGLLTKEPCLCHGISGNALALDDVNFEHFLSFSKSSTVHSL